MQSILPQTFTCLPPEEFLCTHSKKIMMDPVLSHCGHLFERNVACNLRKCPIEAHPIQAKDLVTCTELAEKIKAWKEAFAKNDKAPPFSPVSYAKVAARQNVSSSSSSSRRTQPTFEKGKSPLNKLSPMAASLPSQARTEVLSVAESPPQITRARVIRNAHYDDIHGLALLSSNRFVSGSKDNSLKIWDRDGKELLNMRPGQRGYSYWVTALAKFDNGLWASGTRNGSITVWNDKGQVVNEFNYTPSTDVKNETRSKDRNKERINCIVEEFSDANGVRFYTGTPKFIQLWDGLSGNLLYQYQAHNNDWVYCIQPLKGRKLIVVIGPDMELWQLTNNSNSNGMGTPDRAKLVKEDVSERSTNQRPHISAIQQVDKNINLLASALFDGSVRIVDIEKQSVITRWKEHDRRVWSVINIQDNVIASSADDATIKLWDIRKSKSIMTLGGNPGRVSSLLKLSENQFISGSCPDKVFNSQEKANITFWDIRK